MQYEREPSGASSETDGAAGVRTRVLVSIIIPTFRRAALLKRAILSCLDQSGFEPSEIEILVVDNSPEASAQSDVAALTAQHRERGVGLRYIHEPRAGISHARNAGVRDATGELVAFLDDDEAADRDWLRTLCDCRTQFGADVVLGPVFPCFERPELGADPFWRWVYTKTRPLASGTPIRTGPTGNCVIVKARCFSSDEPFDPAMGLTGGEDIRFFLEQSERGRRIVWCAEAAVREFEPASRTVLRYILKRHLRMGQLFVRSFSWTDPPEVGSICKWMLIGAGQLSLLGPIGLLLWPFDRARASKLLVKAANGLGKIGWLPFLTLKGYGSAFRRRDPSRN